MIVALAQALDPVIESLKEKEFDMKTKPDDPIHHIDKVHIGRHPENGDQYLSHHGLSKREYFAAMAMQGVLVIRMV